MESIGYRKEIETIVNILDKSVRKYYRDRLVSFVVFGSIARGTPRPDSDIDILIIAEKLPRGRIKRVFEFQKEIENKLENQITHLRKKEIYINISPVFKTCKEVEYGSPLFLDMIYDVKILYDRRNFFENYLHKLKEKLNNLNARRVVRGNAWYWILKPDYRYGDVIEL